MEFQLVLRRLEPSECREVEVEVRWRLQLWKETRCRLGVIRGFWDADARNRDAVKARLVSRGLVQSRGLGFRIFTQQLHSERLGPGEFYRGQRCGVCVICNFLRQLRMLGWCRGEI